jgi:hypothetical protein
MLRHHDNDRYWEINEEWRTYCINRFTDDNSRIELSGNGDCVIMEKDI